MASKELLDMMNKAIAMEMQVAINRYRITLGMYRNTGFYYALA